MLGQGTGPIAEDAGLLVLPADAPVGPPARISRSRRPLFTLKLTPNRADCLSLTGIAREVAAITGALRLPPGRKVPSPRPSPIRAVVLDAPAACPPLLRPRHQRASMPKKPDAGLDEAPPRAQRPAAISALVDVTNYVMLELGQPLHAFDNTRRRASIHAWRGPARTVLLLNEQTIAIDPDILADRRRAVKPLAMAGIMGGEESGITLETERTLSRIGFLPRGDRRRARPLWFRLRCLPPFRTRRRFPAAPAAPSSGRPASSSTSAAAAGTRWSRRRPIAGSGHRCACVPPARPRSGLP